MIINELQYFSEVISIYYYIEFPDADRLTEIIEKNYGTAKKSIQEKAIYTFQYLRERTKNAEKTLSTSELLDWVKVLLEYAKNDDFKTTIEQWIEDWKTPEKAEKKEELEKIKTIPYAQVLFKDEKTWTDFKDLMPTKPSKA